MGFLKGVWESVFKLYLLKCSDEKRVKYLRKLGMKIGERCRIRTMKFSTEPYLIELGDHVAIAAGTEFITHDGATWVFEDDVDGGGIFGKIVIGNNVFIGINCIILSNTSIGDNCIVGAGSVVRGNFPENSVIAGNPAQIVSKTGIQRMLSRQNPNLLGTKNFTVSQKDKLVKDHFGIK
ncbi:MAG: acyltransferase [Bacteroidales bacterium]|jgi:acetyltransferase-like isoleucine patch superfamily enzyme|nr:acyltransferase [Bacteroidales bacterium]